jgi:hypothetical protein
MEGLPLLLWLRYLSTSKLRVQIKPGGVPEEVHKQRQSQNYFLMPGISHLKG